MFEFDIDDEFEAFMREVHPHVAEHSTEYSVMRRVFYAGCTTIFHSFFMSNELAALSHDDRSKAFKNVQAQIKEISKREDFDI